MIHYIKGDATDPHKATGEGYKAIVHCCNDVGAWGAGFVLALSKKWPVTCERYLEWATFGFGFQLGKIQIVPVESDIVVVNLIGQSGVGLDAAGNPPVRYDAFWEGFTEMNRMLPDHYSIHMPRMGCGLAGGDWSTVEAIINETLSNRDVTVYDFEPEAECPTSILAYQTSLTPNFHQTSDTSSIDALSTQLASDLG